jgi:diguanylate cyclase (GGDEF)-like protein
MEDHRVRLGTALIARADDVAAAVLTRVWPAGTQDVDPEALHTVVDADRAGAQLIGRWLTGGAHMDEDERRRFGGLGGMIDRLGLDELIKAYLAFRDAMLRVLDEEASRLGTPPELVAEVAAVVSRSNDGAMVRMSRRFEHERQRLHQELDAERAKLADQLLHDALTGLPNRVLLFDRLQHALRVATRGERKLAVLFVDLDGFKAVNDGFGHEAGDQLLVAVGERLCAAIRDGDTVARLGGDEFVVLCEDIDHAAEPVEIAERVIASLKQPFDLPAGQVSISGSVGIAVAGGSDGASELLVRADFAMYAAKQRGPGLHELASVVPAF